MLQTVLTSVKLHKNVLKKKLAGKEDRNDPPIYQVRKLKLREGKPIAESLYVR